MKEYKRGIISYIFSIITAVFAVGLAYIIVRSLISNRVAIIVATLLFLIMAYITIIAENIKIIIQDNNLIYYENNKEVYNIDLKEVKNVSYKKVTKNRSLSTLELYLDDITIDCVPLGNMKFNTLYQDILDIVPQEKVKLKVTKKEDDYEL